MAVVYDIVSGSEVDYDQAIGVTVDYTPGLVIGAGPTESNRALEFVYAPPPGSSPGAEGVFLYPYLGSTKVGNHLTLRRTGGMPAGWKYRVFDAPVPPPPPSVAQPMGTIYEVNMTTQPNQTTTAGGSYTIDGKTWWAKGPLDGGGVSELVNGGGLRLAKSQPQSSNGWYNVNLTHPDRLWVLPLAQLADFAPTAPLAVEARFTSPHGFFANATYCPIIGFGDFTLSAAACTAAEKGNTVYLEPISTTIARWGQDARTSTATGSSVTLTGTTLWDQVVLGLHRFELRRHSPLVGLWDGGLDKPDDYQLYNPLTTPIYPGTLTSTPCFFWLMQKPTSAAAFEVSLTHLKIMQPKVAA